jgi:hypothetical protein
MHDGSLLTPSHRQLAVRKVLLWLLLAFAAAIVSPLVQPKSIELLCTGTRSVKLLVGGTDDTATNAGMAPDCALCLQASLPANPFPFVAALRQNTAHSLQALPLPLAALHAAPPLRARGPPSTLRA